MTREFFSLRPEVAGGLGPDTAMDRSTHPPVVSRLHYELTDWLGDCLVQTFPCFLVLRSTGTRLISAAYTGFHLDTAQVTVTDLYHEINPDENPPELDWLVVHGRPGRDDFGLRPDARLVVSSRALSLMQADSLAHCAVEPWSAVPNTADQCSNHVCER